MTIAVLPDAPPARRLHRAAAAVTRLLRRHWIFLLVLLAAAVLRGLVVVAYRGSFFYFGDSFIYLDGAQTFVPNNARPFGYSLFLWFMHPIDRLWRLAVLQHLAGLGLGAVLYGYAQRRQVPRGIATLLLVPLLLDPRTVVLEHYVLSETLFTCLLVGGALLLCRQPRPGWLACAVSGGLFAGAGLTRTVGVAMLILPPLFLIIRRAGWRRVAVFGTVAGTVLGGYLVWYHHVYGVYSFGTHSGRFLYSRVATFVDCDRLHLTTDERKLCPAEPMDRRLPPDLYLWGPDTAHSRMLDGRYDHVFASFARKAIVNQPVDYARTVVVDVAIFMRPDGGRVDRSGHRVARADCLASLWRIPAPADTPTCTGYWVHGSLVKPVGPNIAIHQREHPLTGPLSAYSRYAEVPVTVVGLAVLLMLVALLWPRRRPSLARAAEPLLWGALGLGLVVASVATSALDPRYAVPSLPLGLIAAALALRRRDAAPTDRLTLTDQPTPPDDRGIPTPRRPWTTSPAEGRPARGRSVEGRSVEGRPVEARSVVGAPATGRAAPGDQPH